MVKKCGILSLSDAESVQLDQTAEIIIIISDPYIREFSQKWKMEKETGVMPLQR